MTLALLTLGLLCVHPASAQSGYPGSGSGSGGSGSGYPGGGPAPDPGHYWKITFVSDGSSDMQYIDGNQYNAPKYKGNPWTDTPGEFMGGGSAGGQYAVDASVFGAVIPTLTWVPAAGNPNDPAPSKVYISETAYAGWSANPAFGGSWSNSTAGAAASDGLGDPQTDNANGMGQTSSGIHLLQRDGTTGTIALTPVTMGANSPPCPLPIIWCYAGASATLRTVLDAKERGVTIYRDGAHDESLPDADGTVHGDTRFSYGSGSGLGAVTVWNTQVFHPRFTGAWTDPSWQWSPQGFSPPDTLNTHSQLIDVGSVMADYSPQQWSGKTDTAKPLTITYTATDPIDGASATAKYILTIHDQYENWRRVSSQGGPIDPNAKGDPGSLTQLATGDNNVPGTIALSVPATPVEWNTDESVGGGFVGAAGAASTLEFMAERIPTWGGVLFTLAGLALQTAASIPPDSINISPPDQFTYSMLQSAFQNYNNNQTALPGQGNTSNLMDANFFQLLQQNPDFQGYYNGDYGTVSVTTTLFAQMLKYYFQGDKYDNGGFLTHNSPGSVTRPGGNVWQYMWHCAGAPQTPNMPPP